MTSYQMSGYAGEANRLCVLTVSGSPGEATLEVKDNDGKTTTSKWIGQVDQFGRCAEMHHACMRCDGFQTLTTEKQTQATSKPRCEVYNVKLRQGETMGVCKRCNYIVCEIASSEGFQFTVPEPGSTEFSFTVLKANSNHTDRHKKFSVWKILKAVGNAADDGSGGIDGLTDLFNTFGIEKEKMPKAIAFCKQNEAVSIREVVTYDGTEDFATALDLPKIKMNKLIKHMQDTYK